MTAITPGLGRREFFQVTGAIGAGLLMFVCGLIIFFPTAALQQRLQHELSKNIPGKVDIGTLSFRLPFSLQGEKISIRMNDPTLPELKLDSLKLTPQLATLIGSLGANFDARGGKDRLNGAVSQNGALSVSAEQYYFNVPIQGFTDLRLSGTVSSALVSTHLQPEPDKSSSFELQVSDLQLSGTGGLGLGGDVINLGRLGVEANGQGRNLQIVRAELTNGDILATATGSMIIGRTAQSTRLNISLTLTPAASLDPSAASMFELIGQAGRDGSRNLNIRGTLARPNVR